MRTPPDVNPCHLDRDLTVVWGNGFSSRDPEAHRHGTQSTVASARVCPRPTYPSDKGSGVPAKCKVPDTRSASHRFPSPWVPTQVDAWPGRRLRRATVFHFNLLDRRSTGRPRVGV